jgi:hypothetical protein
MASKETLTTFPVKVKIYEGADAPLETAPDPEFKPMTLDEFFKSGFQQTPTGRVGDANCDSLQVANEARTRCELPLVACGRARTCAAGHWPCA